MFEHFLEQIGLSEKEALVYLALLGVDYSSPLELAKQTKIKRPTVYTALESLAAKGLVSETTVGKKTRYQAESPEKLETFIDRKKLALEDSKRTLKDTLPQLKSLRKGEGSRPIVRYFEGKEGVVSANNELLEAVVDRKDQETFILYPKDEVDKLFTDTEKKKFTNKRMQTNIKAKSLYTTKGSARPSDEMGNRMKIDGEKYPLKSDITIYGDFVRIAVLGDKLSGILIESKDVAITMKSLFKLAFDNVKGKGPGDI